MADDNIEVPKRGYETADVKAQEQPVPRRKRRWWIVWTLLAIVIVPSLLFSAWTAATLKFTYSSGTRVGYLQKLSKKGWLCRTWEGELAMATVPGTAPQMFDFTVRSDSIAARLQELEQNNGGRVVLHYEQHKKVPLSCFGETEYFVSGADAVGG
jgi:hypothetical protein